MYWIEINVRRTLCLSVTQVGLAGYYVGINYNPTQDNLVLQYRDYSSHIIYFIYIVQSLLSPEPRIHIL